MKVLVLGLILITSCGNPFAERGRLHFRNITQEEQDALRAQELKRERDRLEFLAEKKLTAEKIIADANLGFLELKPLLKQKCFDCHDSGTRLPFYGRIF